MEKEVIQIIQTFWRWRWLMIAMMSTTILVLGLTAIFTEPKYQAKVKMQVTTPEQENVALFDERRYASETEAIVIARNNFKVILESDQVREDTIEKLALTGEDQEYLIEVIPIRDTDFLDILITAHEPKLAADIANTHAQAAIVRMGELSALRSLGAKNHFAKQLEKAKEEMRQAESELGDFQTENGIVDISSALENSQFLLQQLQLERNRILFNEADNQADLVEPIELLITQRRSELEPMLATRSIHNDLISNMTLADAAVQKAEEAAKNADELYQLELERHPNFNIENVPESLREAEVAVQNTEKALQDAESDLKDAESTLKIFLLNNDLVALESEISMLQYQIEQLSLERDQQLLAANDHQANQTAMLKSLKELIAEREAEINTLKILEPQFNLFRMNVDQARARYDLVAGKYSEADLKTDALQTADFLQVVSAAEPPESAVSNVKKLLVFGLAGGIGFAVFLTFLLEYFQGFQTEFKSIQPTSVSMARSQSSSTSSDDGFEGESVVFEWAESP